MKLLKLFSLFLFSAIFCVQMSAGKYVSFTIDKDTGDVVRTVHLPGGYEIKPDICLGENRVIQLPEAIGGGKIEYHPGQMLQILRIIKNFSGLRGSELVIKDENGDDVNASLITFNEHNPVYSTDISTAMLSRLAKKMSDKLRDPNSQALMACDPIINIVINAATRSISSSRKQESWVDLGTQQLTSFTISSVETWIANSIISCANISKEDRRNREKIYGGVQMGTYALVALLKGEILPCRYIPASKEKPKSALAEVAETQISDEKITQDHLLSSGRPVHAGGRAALLDDIKKKKTLNPVEQNGTERKKSDEQQLFENAGDLMQQKMAERRKSSGYADDDRSSFPHNEPADQDNQGW